jgi:prepilin-type N-terminal cleavage/methylation domain-containing protein
MIAAPRSPAPLSSAEEARAEEARALRSAAMRWASEPGASRPTATREAQAVQRRNAPQTARSEAEPSGVRRSPGFTLIEIMAVVLILLLIAAVFVPRVSLIASQAALDDAKQLAAALDFTREKALSLGRPHRLVLDLDHAQYWIEAQPAPAPPEPTLAWAQLEELPLIAPRSDASEYAPLPGVQPTPLDPNVRFAGVESDDGAASEGVAQIAFDPDGATLAASVWLSAGDALRVRVEVAPLADPTRVSFDAGQ